MTRALTVLWLAAIAGLVTWTIADLAGALPLHSVSYALTAFVITVLAWPVVGRRAR